jgi:phosphatidylglycerophosphate synthase
MPHPVYTLPNLISALRLLSVPVLVWLTIIGLVEPFRWLLLGALLSDILDGWIARTFHLQTRLGAALDAAADTALIACGIIGVIVFQPQFFAEQKIWVVVLIAGFVVARIFNFIRYHKLFNSFHTYLAKVQAYVVGAFVLSLFFFGYQWFLFYPAFVLMFLNTVEEMILLSLLPSDQADVKGLYWILKKRNKETDVSA